MSNRLSDCTSLYLRQHADNPVHWHPWDEQALQEARDTGRPILLSIGYSACHWCHVMAHESFEDNDTAAVMNAAYVNIKVDREERPDLDRLYQLSHQLLTGRGGGWPLTVFLEPGTLTPFFAGTYFPPTPRHGMPSFQDVLRRVRQWYDSSGDEVAELNANLRRAIRSIQARPAAADASTDPVPPFITTWQRQVDPQHGGTLGAPKFPQAPLLAALPTLARFSDDSRLLEQLDLTLERMSRGGLRDHLDGGFFRYTVDEDWTIPHFEKMLYDNAQLLPLYAEAARRTGHAWFAEVAAGMAGWMQDSLLQDDGGFGASIDADADGEEGGFHVWTASDWSAALSPPDREWSAGLFGLDGPPNFEQRAWHLVRASEPDDPERMDRLVRQLLEHRAQRVPPTTDTKRLASWNALAIDGLARAGLALDRADWLEQAGTTLDFVRRHLWRDNRLWAVSDGGEAAFPAYLDDHAFLLRAVLRLLQARWRADDLDFAATLGDGLLDRFEDPETGGFFFTADGEEAPVARLKTVQDDATPSGYAVAMIALMDLGHLLGEPRYTQAAQRALEACQADLTRYPLAHATAVHAHVRFEAPPVQVILRGPDPSVLEEWRAVVIRIDGVHCYAIPPSQSGGTDPAGADAGDATTTATVCKGMRCLPPFTTLDALAKELESRD